MDSLQSQLVFGADNRHGSVGAAGAQPASVRSYWVRLTHASKEAGGRIYVRR